MKLTKKELRIIINDLYIGMTQCAKEETLKPRQDLIDRLEVCLKQKEAFLHE